MRPQRILPDQGLMETRERWQAVLKFFGEDEIALKLDSMWASQSRSFSNIVNAQRWEELQQEVAKVYKVRLDLMSSLV